MQWKSDSILETTDTGVDECWLNGERLTSYLGRLVGTCVGVAISSEFTALWCDRGNYTHDSATAMQGNTRLTRDIL